MNAALEKTKDAIEAINKIVYSAMRIFSLIGRPEDALLDKLEQIFAEYYKSSDEKCMEEVAAMDIVLGCAWNKAVDKVGDSAFHKDALTKRFQKIILEECSHED